MVEKPLIRLGVSSCLLGENVRYDGGHKLEPLLEKVFGAHVEWVSVCPEVAIGLGVPRNKIQLENRDGMTKLIMPLTAADYTDPMIAYADDWLAGDGDGVYGMILKSKSPSCGIKGVKVAGAGLGAGHGLAGQGRGIFSDTVALRVNGLPVIDEVGLKTLWIRELFISQVIDYANDKCELATDDGLAALKIKLLESSRVYSIDQ